MQTITVPTERANHSRILALVTLAVAIAILVTLAVAHYAGGHSAPVTVVPAASSGAQPIAGCHVMRPC